jgi:hypothetical protein
MKTDAFSSQKEGPGVDRVDRNILSLQHCTHNDELHDLYSSPNIVRVIKLRRMRWAGHVTCMGRGEVLTAFWLGGSKARDHWKDLGVGGR